ncbi:MAG: HAMP domain-containing sensor histidine kinase, partial [Myxococcota bacterium]
LECFEPEFAAVLTHLDGSDAKTTVVGLPESVQLSPTDRALKRPPLDVLTLSGDDIAEYVNCDIALAEVTLCTFSTEGTAGLVILGITDQKATFFTPFASDQGSSFAVLASSARALLENYRAQRIAELRVERLQEANQAKTELMANISHDLRTPLNAIINLPEGLLEYFVPFDRTECSSCGSEFELEPGEVLETDAACPGCGATTLSTPTRTLRFEGDSERAHRALDIIRRSGGHLLSVINDILDMSSLEASQMSFAPRSLVLETVVAEALTTCENQACEKEVTLEVLSEGETRLEGDQTRLAQIVINLVSNAIKFSPPSGVVSIAVRQDGDFATLSVRDQGGGIAPEHQDLIFESFRQVPRGSDGWTGRHSGTGLGLAICKKLVNLHGGTIEVHSRLGEGAEFRVRLPTRIEVSKEAVDGTL